MSNYRDFRWFGHHLHIFLIPPLVRKRDEVEEMEMSVRNDDKEARFEERAVALVLFLAGLLGVLLGMATPRTSGAELAVGFLLAALGVWTWIRASRSL